MVHSDTLRQDQKLGLNFSEYSMEPHWENAVVAWNPVSLRRAAALQGSRPTGSLSSLWRPCRMYEALKRNAEAYWMGKHTWGARLYETSKRIGMGLLLKEKYKCKKLNVYTQVHIKTYICIVRKILCWSGISYVVKIEI